MTTSSGPFALARRELPGTHEAQDPELPERPALGLVPSSLPPEPPRGEERFRLLESLVAAAHRATVEGDVVLGELGVTIAQLGVLMVMNGAAAVTHGELAARLGIRKSSVSGMVDRLVSRGWVARARAVDDARRSYLLLTPGGQEMAARGAATVERLVGELTPGMTEADRSRLADLLDRVATDAA